VYVEVAEVDLGWRITGVFIGKSQRLVVEDVVEEGILNVVPCENL
jgi:hypothetical protein